MVNEAVNGIEHKIEVGGFSAKHDHVYLGSNHERNARRTWMVIALTAVMMVVEIAAGTAFGSMALVADGWHMSTHAAAMLITALAYSYAKRHVNDPSFTFGTGKVGDLAGFTSAIVLAIVALLIGWESVQRFVAPVPISFGDAILVAILGLAVNLVCALILKDDEAHHHHHGHSHVHAHDHSHDHDHEDEQKLSDHARDNNLRGAYIHVLADALTSVLAIAALAFGSLYGWIWLDPLMGLVGAVVIVRWSFGLARDAGEVLLDKVPDHNDLPDHIRHALKDDAEELEDLHVWQVGPGHHAAIIALKAKAAVTPADCKAKLVGIHGLSHVSVEVNDS